MQKGLAHKILKDRPPEVLKDVDSEIDAAPTMEEQQAAQADQMRQRLSPSIQDQFIKGTAAPNVT